MISSKKMSTLVERVIKRLFNEDMGTASTDFPSSSSSPQTIPASQSRAELDAAKDLSGKNTRNPKSLPMSQNSIKINNIRKSLDSMGYTIDTEHAKEVTHNLSTWYDELDPEEALVRTADQLAQQYMMDHGVRLPVSQS